MYVLSYFQDGLKTIEHFHCYIEELVVQLGRLKQNQDAERRKLVELRDVLRTFMSSYKDVSFNVEWRFFIVVCFHFHKCCHCQPTCLDTRTVFRICHYWEIQKVVNGH